MAAAGPPLVIMAFNRPAYLRHVLGGLIANGIGKREVHLFQDGPVSPRTGARYAADADIEASVATFRELVPHGTVHRSPDNLGVAMNFRRAERYVFLERECELAYFFEDDLVVSPHYLAMLDHIAAWAMTQPKVAYFSAFGSWKSTVEVQQVRAREMHRMSMHWGFAVKRSAWLKINALLDEVYYPRLEQIDYKQRKLFRNDFFNELKHLNVLPPVISQDAMKGLAMHVAGMTKVNTFACFADYIGAEGVHSNEARFLRKGFGHSSVYPEMVALDFPDDEKLDAWLADSQRRFAAVWRSHFAPGEGEPTYIEKRRASNRRLNPPVPPQKKHFLFFGKRS